MKVFVGSSTIAKRQAKLFIENCKHPNFEYLPWWDQFTPGRTLLEELDRIKNEVQAVILILSPEGVATNHKGTQIVIPNMNVLFEFGYFYSSLSKARVGIVKYGKVNLPSDLSGYIHIFGSDYFKAKAGVPVSKRTKKDFDKWVDGFIK